VRRDTEQQIEQRFPETWDVYRSRAVDFRWPGGETGAEAQSRIVSFLEETRPRAGGNLVVTHGGIVWLLLCHLLNIPVYQGANFRVEPTGYVEIVASDSEKGWTIVRSNAVTMGLKPFRTT
jgi:broad specificity phosphatase PhoE